MQDIPHTGYKSFSVFLHWVSAVLLIAMFVTHSGGEESLQLWFHHTIGPAIGLLLVIRVLYRLRLGLPAQQHTGKFPVNTIIIWAFLCSILILVMTGFLLPWSSGNAVNMVGMEIPAPFYVNPIYNGTINLLHQIAAYLLAPLLLLHIILAIHPERMFSPEQNGH